METLKKTGKLIEEEKVIKGEKKEIISLKAVRTVDGISLSVKSEEIQKFFSRNMVSSKGAWLGQSNCYNLPRMEQKYSNIFNNWGLNTLFINGKKDEPQLAYLTSTKLGEGFTINMPLVVSKSELIRYTRAFKDAIKVFYEEYMKPANINLSIYTVAEGDLVA